VVSASQSTLGPNPNLCRTCPPQRSRRGVLSLDGSAAACIAARLRPPLAWAPVKENLAAGPDRLHRLDGRVPLGRSASAAPAPC